MHTVNRRRALVATLALVAMVASGLGVSAASTVPSGSKRVSVAAGKTHKGINGTLPASGAITGKLTVQGSHKAAGSVGIYAFNTKGGVAATGFSDSQGRFHIYGLEAGKYRVCVPFPPSPSPTYKYGLSAACIGTNSAPSFFNVPKDAKQFPVHRGHATKANLALPKAGAISGTVKSSSGKKLENVGVQAFQGQQFVRGDDTDSDGSYLISNLRPGKYKVCFVGENSGSVTTNTATGVLRQCWSNVAYPGTKVPANAKSATVKPGKNKGGVNAKMRPAGAIAGKVTSATNHKPLRSSSVEVFKGGKFYTSTFTNNKGKYLLKDLATGNYQICAEGGSERNQVGATAGRCYKNAPLKHFKPGSTAKNVSAKTGKIHKNINLKLPTKAFKPGSITGKLTGPGGVAIGGANVEAEGSPSGSSATTQSDGTYTISSLFPGKYTVCFDPGQFAQPATGTAPADGYSKVCYKNAKWAGGSSAPASGAAKVTVKPGKTTKNVNGKVGKGGAISGTAKVAGGGNEAFVDIDVLDSKGFNISSTEANGSYTIPGLTPSSPGYFVCFSPVGANFNPPNNLGYIGQCYQNKDWHPPVIGGFAQHRPTRAEIPANLHGGQWRLHH
jgi:hypothetical protein